MTPREPKLQENAGDSEMFEYIDATERVLGEPCAAMAKKQSRGGIHRHKHSVLLI